VPDAVQAAMIQHLKSPMVRATSWLLHPRRLAQALQPLIERLQPAVAMQRARLEPAAAGSPLVAEWVAAGVPGALAQAVAATDGLFEALDIAELAESQARSLEDIGALHHAIGQRLGLRRLQRQIEALPAENHWTMQAKIALSGELAELQRAVTLRVLGRGGGGVQPALQAWEEENRQELHGAEQMLAELAEARPADLAMLSVALRKLRNLS
jgi:glutamate dehydrogenase